MNTTTNGHSNVLTLLNELREKKSAVEQQITSVEQVMALLGVKEGDDPVAHRISIGPIHRSDTLHKDSFSIRGMKQRDALFEIARHNNGVVNTVEAAKMFMEQGVGSYAHKESAQASVYIFLKTDKRFFKHRDGTGNFTMFAAANKEPAVAPTATRVTQLTPGQTYAEMIREFARANNGVIKTKDLAEAILKAKPSSSKGRIHSAISSTITGDTHSDQFVRLGRGVYRLRIGI